MNVSWDTVKEIHSIYLKGHYSPPSLDGVECIGIDELAVKKGHMYKTVVVDLATGRILYVGDGKGADALADFWKRVKRKGVRIKYVATDLSAAFIASVLENCPDAIHVFDHFHVVKLMNDKLDDIRRMQYNMEADINKRKVLKGTRYLLLSQRIKGTDSTLSIFGIEICRSADSYANFCEGMEIKEKVFVESFDFHKYDNI